MGAKLTQTDVKMHLNDHEFFRVARIVRNSFHLSVVRGQRGGVKLGKVFGSNSEYVAQNCWRVTAVSFQRSDGLGVNLGKIDEKLGV